MRRLHSFPRTDHCVLDPPVAGSSAEAWAGAPAALAAEVWVELVVWAEVQVAWAAEVRAVWAVVEAGIPSACSEARAVPVGASPEVSAEARASSAVGVGAWVAAAAVFSVVEAVA